jgi:LPXTG-motif cell wall-anchored protein
LVCREISGTKKCVNANCTSETDCDCGTTYSNPTPTPSRSPNPPNPSPTPTPKLPVTGAFENTLALLGLGVLILSGGLWAIKSF